MTLMTQFTYEITKTTNIKSPPFSYAVGTTIVVTRLSDNAQKRFFLAGDKDPLSLSKFMDSITDELAEGYFPREHRKKEKKNG